MSLHFASLCILARLFWGYLELANIYVSPPAFTPHFWRGFFSSPVISLAHDIKGDFRGDPGEFLHEVCQYIEGQGPCTLFYKAPVRRADTEYVITKYSVTHLELYALPFNRVYKIRSCCFHLCYTSKNILMFTACQ